MRSETVCSRTILLGLLFPLLLSGQKFYDDDPLQKEPPPVHTEGVAYRGLNVYIELLHNTFGKPGERHPDGGAIPSGAVNTLGEVPDSAWYVNRHGRNRMTIEELVRGPGNENAPSDGVWSVIAGKAEGVTPGFTIKDAHGRQYLLKLDPPGNIELASGAEVVATRFFHALGYHVPQNYVVYFDRGRLALARGAELRDPSGKGRPMTNSDIDGILDLAPRHPRKGHRGVASLYLDGEDLGPFRFRGTRQDDPNDIVHHEHRRDLRGLFVFSAWLGHHDIKAANTLDLLVEEHDLRYIKHHLIDFNACLGSDSVEPKAPRDGHEYLFAWKPSIKRVAGLGFYAPRWTRAGFPDFPSIGRFEHEVFEPEQWKPRHPLPAFENRLPGDCFWAARQVMAFTDEEIRAIVATGQYSDPDGEEWLAKCLIERRDKIGRRYFAKVLPLDGFRVAGDRLEFDDLEVDYGFAGAREYTVHWSHFDNSSEKHTPIPAATGPRLPQQISEAPYASCFAARIAGGNKARTVTVYLRKQPGGLNVVGIDRTW